MRIISLSHTMIILQALQYSCDHQISEVLVKEFELLELIEPEFFVPVSEKLEGIFIRNNPKLSYIVAGLFQGMTTLKCQV